MLDPKLLHAFVAVGRTRSFAKAADQLNVTQSWVSRQVAALERQIGFKLFDRTTRTVQLTPRGEKLFARAAPVVEGIAGVQALAARLGEEDRSLTLGLPTYALLAEAQVAIVDTFVRSYPRIATETRIDSGASLGRRLRRGEIDVAFVIAGYLGDDGFEEVVVAHGALDVVFPREAEFLPGSDTVPLAAFAGTQVAAFAERANPDLFEHVFGKVQQAGARMIELSDNGFHRNLAERGAVTILPSWQPLPGRGLSRKPIADTARCIDLACVRNCGQDLAIVDAFWALASRQSGHP